LTTFVKIRKKPLFPGACIYVQLSGLVIEGQPQRAREPDAGSIELSGLVIEGQPQQDTIAQRDRD
jgi:hypothetical protein